MALVLMQNSNVDAISTFSNTYQTNPQASNVKTVKNPLVKITWIVSVLFFANTIALSKVMYYKSNTLLVDKVIHKSYNKENSKEIIDVPFNS